MFQATRVLAMQPTRMMMMRPTQQAFMRASPQLFMRQTMPLRATPKEDHGAHTASQRIRQAIKGVPTEIWPLLVVMGVAVVAAFFSLGRKLWVDKTLRLKRQGKLD